MPISDAKKIARDKWDQANMTILGCKVRKDYADRVRAVAERRGEAVNAVIKRALDQYLAEHEQNT